MDSISPSLQLLEQIGDLLFTHFYCSQSAAEGQITQRLKTCLEKLDLSSSDAHEALDQKIQSQWATAMAMYGWDGPYSTRFWNYVWREGVVGKAIIDNVSLRGVTSAPRKRALLELCGAFLSKPLDLDELGCTGDSSEILTYMPHDDPRVAKNLQELGPEGVIFRSQDAFETAIHRAHSMCFGDIRNDLLRLGNFELCKLLYEKTVNHSLPALSLEGWLDTWQDAAHDDILYQRRKGEPMRQHDGWHRRIHSSYPILLRHCAVGMIVSINSALPGGVNSGHIADLFCEAIVSNEPNYMFKCYLQEQIEDAGIDVIREQREERFG